MQTKKEPIAFCDETLTIKVQTKGVAFPLRSRDFKGVQGVVVSQAFGLQARSGSKTRSIGYQEDVSPTLFSDGCGCSIATLIIYEDEEDSSNSN